MHAAKLPPWGFCPGNGRRSCPWRASQRGGGRCPRCVGTYQPQGLEQLAAFLPAQLAELRAKYPGVAKPLKRSRR